MTYGWAIIIILGALGALYLLGVFSADPTANCLIEAPFTCTEAVVYAEVGNNDNEGVLMNIGLSGKNTGTISEIRVNGETCVLQEEVKLEENKFEQVFCNLDLEPEEGVIVEFDASYKQTGSDFDQEIVGTISGASEKPPAQVYTLEEDEEFRNPDSVNLALGKVAHKLVVIENNLIRFFLTSPSIEHINPPEAIAAGEPNPNQFAGVPARIWTKDGDSEGNNVNNRIFDDLRFFTDDYDNDPDTQSSTGYLTVSSPSQIKANPTGVKIIADPHPNSQSTIIYELEPIDHYIKISIITENTGSDPIESKQRLSGDMDLTVGLYISNLNTEETSFAPENYDSSTTYNEICDNNEIVTIDKWFVLGRTEEYNDMVGFINTNTNAHLRFFCASQMIFEQKTPVTIQPGETEISTLYIYSNLKGEEGEEWKPVETAYNQILNEETLEGEDRKKGRGHAN